MSTTERSPMGHSRSHRPPRSVRKHLRRRKAELRRELPSQEAEKAIRRLRPRRGA